MIIEIPSSQLQALRDRICVLEQEIACEAVHMRPGRWVEIQVDYDTWVECCKKYAPQFLTEEDYK